MPFSLGYWAAAGAGGGAAAGAYEQIETQVLSTTATGISFVSVPQTYKHLQIRMTTRQNSTAGIVHVELNGDTSNGYTYHYLQGDGSSVTSTAATSTRMQLGFSAFSTDASGIFAAYVVDILDYTATTKNKTIRSLGGLTNAAATKMIRLSSGLFSTNTNAVTQVDVKMNANSFFAGSRFTLYGIRG